MTTAAVRGMLLALELTEHLQRGNSAVVLSPEQNADLREAAEYARYEKARMPSLLRWSPKFSKM